MTTTKNQAGLVFGKLTVIEREPSRGDGRARMLCVCQCGTPRTVRLDKLQSGHTQSCGCLQRAAASDLGKTFTTHGDKTGGKCAPEYKSWTGMIGRCENPKNKKFPDYGGRGITVCDRWRGSYALFLADMGRKPSPNHSIDRENNNGNYEPINCRWATPKQQANNRRTRRIK